jgi:hypothetical protein
MSKTKFRKGERVIDTRKPPLVAATYEGMTGTVTNPTPDCGYIRIRLDSQQPCEKGILWPEDALAPCPPDVDNFHRRIYTLYNMTHNEIAALRLALEHVNYRDDVLTDEMVQKLLNELPTLP